MPPLTSQQEADIARMAEQEFVTRRPTAPGIESIMFKRFPVLNDGFIRVVDYQGNDASIVQAARTSYAEGTQRRRQDRGLIRYLMRNRHTSPFEMARIELHLRMPIFVARQWVRHRTASLNEISARYSILADDWYEPEPEAVAEQSTTNRQGRGDALSSEDAESVRGIISRQSASAFAEYAGMVNRSVDGEVIDPERPSVARELARTVVPVGAYTELYWIQDLHNLMGFVSLRADDHAQYEIRCYAEIILHEIMAKWVPVTYEAFLDYRVNGAGFSAAGMAVLRKMLGDRIDHVAALREESGLAGSEWEEFEATIRG